MLLAIDVGNTNTLFAIHDGTDFVGEWRCATDHQRTADEYYVWLRSLMQLAGLDVKIEAVAISSVVPQIVLNLRILCATYYDTRPLVVGKPECALPVGVRVDDGVRTGQVISPFYDSMVAKVITYGRHRDEAIARMERALGETLFGGIRTNVPLHQRIIAHEDFKSGNLSTRFLERL